MDDEYLTTGQVAERLAVTPAYVWHLVQQRRLPARRIGRSHQWFITLTDLDQFVRRPRGQQSNIAVKTDRSTERARSAGPRAPQRDREPTIVVRDMRNVPYYRVHNLIIDDYGPLLRTDGLAIYSTLCLMADFETQKCWPSLVGMAAHWGMSKSTVIRVVELMQDLRLILIERGKQENGAKANNTYFLLEPLPLEEAVVHLRRSLWERGQRQAEQARQAGTELDDKQRCKYDDIDQRILDLLPGGLVALRSQATFNSRDRWQQFLATLPPLSTNDAGGTGAYLGSTDEYRRGIAEYLRGADEDQGGPPPYQVVPSGTTGSPAPYPNKNQKEDPQTTTQEPPTTGGGVLLRTDAEIEGYLLAEDEVLVLVDEERGTLQPWRIEDVARRDLEATRTDFGIPVRSTCYYTVDQVFGETDDQSATIAQHKQATHAATEERLKKTFREIGAFGVRAALTGYFTASVAASFCAESDAAEEQRVYGWLRYVHGEQGHGIENPAGYLRSRLTSREWAPPPPARPGRR